MDLFISRGPYMNVVENFQCDWSNSQSRTINEKGQSKWGMKLRFQYNKQAKAEDFCVKTQNEKNYREEREKSLYFERLQWTL